MQPSPDAAWSDLYECALQAIQGTETANDLQRVKVEQLGRKSWITEALRSLSELPEKQRRSAGQTLNQYKQELQQQLQEREGQLAGNSQSAGAFYDCSLPGRGAQRGTLHPVSQVLQRARSIFVNMGYRVVEGPEIEYEYYNFDALNIPPWHPARAMHDTFYMRNEHDEQERYGRILLRTHTSPMQVRVMQSEPPPIFIISPGRTYRADSDLTHTPMFHQIEGLAIDENITFADLKGTVQHFLEHFFGDDLQVRFRASYFPFTEPSAEVDLQCMDCRGEGCRICKGSGWLEIMGCGMVHPKVLSMSGIDPEKYNGFAFGMGMERIAMLTFGIEDMRLMYQGNLDFLKQY